MFSRYACISVLFFAACDSAGTITPKRDGMLMFEDQDLSIPVVPDLAVAHVDMAMETEDLSLVPQDLKASMRSDMAGTGACGIKVNELVLSTFKGTTSRASDEYVELYNPCSTSKSLKNWSIGYRSSGNNSGANNPDVPLVQNINKTIPAMGYLLFAGTQYAGSATKDGSLINGLADSGGGVALIDDQNNIVDSVAYGPVDANHNYLEGTHAPLPPQSKQPGMATARSPNGTDTDDNGADFTVQPPTPKKPNT